MEKQIAMQKDLIDRLCESERQMVNQIKNEQANIIVDIKAEPVSSKESIRRTAKRNGDTIAEYDGGKSPSGRKIKRTRCMEGLYECDEWNDDTYGNHIGGHAETVGNFWNDRIDYTGSRCFDRCIDYYAAKENSTSFREKESGGLRYE